MKQPIIAIVNENTETSKLICRSKKRIVVSQAKLMKLTNSILNVSVNLRMLEKYGENAEVLRGKYGFK